MDLAMMSDAQAASARVALTEESARRHHLVVYLSGSHAYGFPSPDSDLDLKAVHIAPTRALLGISSPRTAFNRLEVISGIEIDYTSNELAGVVRGILAGNGNYLERVLGALSVTTSPEHEALKPLVKRAISAKLFRHYAGFSNSQRRAAENSRNPTAKKFLYVLRTALTGTHLLNTGELVIDVRELLDEYGFGGARELIEIKLAGERTVLSERDAEHWRGELERVMSVLEQARDNTALPAKPENVDELTDWLLEVRKSFW